MEGSVPHEPADRHVKVPVLLIGATGLFGGLLARQLIEAGSYDVICAGRDEGRLGSFCRAHGGRAHVLDISHPKSVADALSLLRPFVVIDAAGPFQSYGDDPYSFARSAIGAGAHYIDIADGASFVSGFSALDGLAREKGVVAITGASTTPGLTSAVVDELAKGLDAIDDIETAIVPGNRTARGLSVMRAILGQVGQRFKVWRDGRWREATGWGDTIRLAIEVPGRPPVRGRLASLVETPDVALFPSRYGARSVGFRAGLELAGLHRALEAGAWLVARGVFRSLEPFAAPALRLANLLQHRGSDVGGMCVCVVGRSASTGRREIRRWNLIAADGHGPRIPVQPAALVLERIVRGELAPGARPCLGEVGLGELERAMAVFGVATASRDVPHVSLFRAVLGEAFDTLPEPVRSLHDTVGLARYAGRARIDGPVGLRARLAARLAGFPPASTDLPVEVSIEAHDGGETWTRRFGSHVFRSRLTRDAASGDLCERFGSLSFRIPLETGAGELRFPVRSGRFLGVLPLPGALLPVSVTRERVDGQGRFCFEVEVRLADGSRVVRYEGFLEPVEND